MRHAELPRGHRPGNSNCNICQAARVPAGVGAAILILGVVAFVLTGYNWLVLALIWSFGLLHIGLLVRTFRRAQNRQQARISR